MYNGLFAITGPIGLGERDEDIRATMKALRDHDVDILTFGQYLR